jgi:hypothetical protein
MVLAIFKKVCEIERGASPATVALGKQWGRFFFDHYSAVETKRQPRAKCAGR